MTIQSIVSWTICAVAVLSLTSEGHAQSFRDCDSCPEMVIIPAGSFTMGSPENEADRSPDEGPQRTVTFAKPFAMGKYEVTYGEFLRFVKATGRAMEPCFHEPGFGQTDLHPATCITWKDANAYVEWLSSFTSSKYRLPTEAEWEYATRAATQPGTYPIYSYGNSIEKLCEYADSAETACNDGYEATAPVGSFEPNAFGLHDMHGNVWEMIQDCPTDNYKDAPIDGSAATGGNCAKRVIRGGAWVNRAGHLRAANRGWIGLDLRDVLTGLRVVKE
jgi:formylglycine-generating enzyme required for sulfatase activity